MDDSDDILLFSDYRTEAIGFPSTTSVDHSQRHVRHQEIATDPLPTMVDQNAATNARLDIGVQTSNTQPPLGGALAKCDDTALAAWLRHICPAIEKELALGPTPVSGTLYGSSTSSSTSWLGTVETIEAIAHQVITLNVGRLAASNETTGQLRGCAAWLSVATHNAPMLALSGSAEHNAWCDHIGATVEIFKPTRNQNGSDIYYAPYRTLGVKSCVQALSTNPHNKDMLAAGCYSGDVCVWLFQRVLHVTAADAVVEVANDVASQYGCVVGLAWLTPKQNDSVECHLLSAHADGMVVLWKIVTAKSGQHNRMTREKLFSIKSARNPKESARISAITVLGPDQFAIGTEDGHICLCSLTTTTTTTRTTAQQTTVAVLDPIVAELCEPHRFAVTTLRVLDSVAGTLVSGDVSGEVFFRSRSLIGGDLDALVREAPWKVLRMPMKTPRFTITRDGRRLVCAGRDGALELNSVDGQPPKSAIPGKCSGTGNMCALSDNECWAITGMYDNNSFQLYQITKQ